MYDNLFGYLSLWMHLSPLAVMKMANPMAAYITTSGMHDAKRGQSFEERRSLILNVLCEAGQSRRNARHSASLNKNFSLFLKSYIFLNHNTP